MNDLYLAEDGTIRSRRGNTHTRDRDQTSGTASTNANVSVWNNPLIYWSVCLGIIALIAWLGSCIVSEWVAASSEAIGPTYVSVMVFIGAFACSVLYNVSQRERSEHTLIVGTLWAIGGVIIGAILAYLTELLLTIFIIAIIIGGFIGACES